MTRQAWEMRDGRRGASRLRRWLTRALLGVVVLVGLAGGAAALWMVTRPGLDDLERKIGTAPVLQDADGAALVLARGVTNVFVPLAEFPAHLPEAVIAVEDRRFREHGGVDWRATMRALTVNVGAGEVVEGGSTITQQLIKIGYLTPERTLTRKLHEALLARELEARHSKDEILELYLNNVYMGSGVHGIGSAAQVYFGKTAQDLTPAESAVLAGIIRAPSAVNPFSKPEAARERAGLIIDLMERQGRLDKAEADRARLALATMRFRRGVPAYDGWFAEWVADEAAAIAASIDGPVIFRTTLDPLLQQRAEDAVRDVLNGTGMEAALVALRADGTVAAMVGGRNFEESEFNRAVDAKRQPGSTFKTFVYLAALADGMTPGDTVEDREIEIDGYSPKNFNGRYAGTVTLQEAFARSMNAAAVNLAMQVGIGRVAEVARLMGIEAELTETPSLALGASEVPLLDLVEAYAALATGRAPVEARGLAAVSLDGRTFEPLDWRETEPDAATAAVLAQADAMGTMLRAVVTDGTGRTVSEVPGAVGKTGTSQEHRDALFVGWNTDLIVGVWVGNDDNSPMEEVTGGSLPGEIWKRFLLGTGATPDAAPASEPAPVAPEDGAVAGAAEGGADAGEAPLRGGTAEDRVRALAEALGGAGGDAPQCNVAACRRQYRSFRESDCTFQPYGNRPRERCTR